MTTIKSYLNDAPGWFLVFLRHDDEARDDSDDDEQRDAGNDGGHVHHALAVPFGLLAVGRLKQGRCQFYHQKSQPKSMRKFYREFIFFKTILQI